MLVILKKIGKILVVIVISFFVLYLFIGFVLIPFGLPWVIKSQGTRLLNHPVSVNSARFNPFTLRLDLQGLKILDKDKQLMAGFKKFWVDVSFISLLKKQYRVESLGLDSMNLNVALLPDNQINLMALLPKPAPQSQISEAASNPKAKKSKPALKKSEQVVPGPSPALPDVLFDEIILRNGTVVFMDKSIGPGFVTRLSAMDLRVTGVSTKPDSQIKLVFKSNIDDKGLINTEALLKPFVQPLQMEAVFSLNNYALRALTPYVGKYTGRAVKEGGKLDVKVDYRVADNKLIAGHKVLIQRFNFGEKVESKDALSLPFGLAVSLLEDPQGRIDISLPVTGDISDPKFEYFHLLGQVAKNFFIKLVTAPFKILLAIVPMGAGSTEDLGSVSFVPGSTVLSEVDKQKLQLLVKVMKERPKLSLEINGSFDPEADWKSMKTQAFDTEFANMRKNSTRPDFRLYEDMYKFRFGMTGYWELARKYTSKGKLDEETLKAEMKRQVIEKGAPDRAALEALARARAKTVYDAIVAAGFDPARVKTGNSRAAQMSLGIVPLEFTLTVFDDSPKVSDNSPVLEGQ